MRVKIKVSGLEQLAKLPIKTDRALRQGVGEWGSDTLQTKQEQINITYLRPIPNNRWRRSDAWRNGQRIRRPNSFTRRIVTIGKASRPITNYIGGYEQKLANLPDGYGGVNRSNDAAGIANKLAAARGRKIIMRNIERGLS